MTTQQGTIHIIQNSIPIRYNPRVRVVPCSPDRVPYLPVQILYLIAQALPRPKWVYNLARVNKHSWYYLQPALFQCEVTYEARLKEHFGIDCGTAWKDGSTGRATDDGKETQEHCRHSLRTTLCEECGDRIAIEKVIFRADWRADFMREAGTANVTALHWACAKGADGVPAGLKAIRAASVHQPSYIDGTGLILRNLEYSSIGDSPGADTYGNPKCGEIPSPLSLAVAFGNLELCEAMIEAGCNVNLLQPGGCTVDSLCDATPDSFKAKTLFKIHDKCRPEREAARDCQWYDDTFIGCQTAGHVAVSHQRPAFLKLLVDGGLDPHLGKESLIHVAVSEGDLAATMILLDCCPELSQDDEGDGRTPLHSLSRILMPGRDFIPFEVLKAIASALVQKGASLEAVNLPSRWFKPGTPLQHALQWVDKTSNWFYNHLLVAEAFIQLGADWDQPVRPWMPYESILDHCILRATKRSSSISWSDTYFPTQQMGYARVVKAIVESGRGRVNLIVSHRKAFLDGFNDLARRSISVPEFCDAFATEVVGKLLLSTGITPDASLVSKWTQSLLKTKASTMHIPSGRNRNLWEDLMSDRQIEQ